MCARTCCRGSWETDVCVRGRAAAGLGKRVCVCGRAAAGLGKQMCVCAEVLDRVGVDAAGIGSIVDAITGKGIAFDRVVGISQGWRLTGAIKTTERKLAEKNLEHCASPLMAWNVGNARVEPRGNAVMISKQQSGTAKIDCLMATFDAVALMGMNPSPRKKRYQMIRVT